MKFLSYPLDHPYPKRHIFEPLTFAVGVVVLIILTLINIFTSGFDIVVDLRPDYHPTDVAPDWWNTPLLPKLLRPNPPPCQPKDLGRGDVFRLSASLFEYKVLSSWRNLSAEVPEQTRIDYRGASFDSCFPYEARLDFSQVDWTQTITTAIVCAGDELNLFMESTVTFADEISKDMIGQYYGYDTVIFDFLGGDPHDYRRAVFGVLDAISTDSIIILQGQHLASPILALSTRVDLSSWIDNKNLSTIVTTVSYINGTVDGTDGSMGPATVYQRTVQNLFAVVTDAILLDLGIKNANNIFLNRAAVNSTIVDNRPPQSISPNDWLGDTNSWYYGGVVEPYQTWAEMLRAGLPSNITLGNITGLPDSSQMVTSYLCPTYQRKRISSFLSSLFVATVAMLISAWGAWKLVTAFIAKRYVKEPCFQCSCGESLDKDVEKAHHLKRTHDLTPPKLGEEPTPSIPHDDSTDMHEGKEKEGRVTKSEH